MSKLLRSLAMRIAFAVGVSNGEYARYWTQRKLRDHVGRRGPIKVPPATRRR